MEKRDKEMPYEVIIQERNKVDLYGNVVYYIYWFDNNTVSVYGLIFGSIKQNNFIMLENDIMQIKVGGITYI